MGGRPQPRPIDDEQLKSLRDHVSAAPSLFSSTPVNATDALRLVLAERDWLARNTRELLARVAERRKDCEGCGVPLFMVRHTNGALAPYTELGLNHYADCPDRDQFKRKR